MPDQKKYINGDNLVTYDGIIKDWVQSQGAKTVSGNPVVITDAEAMNADKILAHINDANGVNSIKISRTGKSRIQLITKESWTYNGVKRDKTAEGWIVLSGTDSGPNYSDHRYYLDSLLIGAGTYRFVIEIVNPSGVNLGLFLFDGSGYRNNGQTFTLSGSYFPGGSNFFIRTYSGVNYDGVIIKAMICKSTDSTEMEPYKGINYTINLGDTYTSANVDITNGIIMDSNNNVIKSITPTQIPLLENNTTIVTDASSLDVVYQTNNGIGDTARALDQRITQLDGGKANGAGLTFSVDQDGILCITY